MRWSTRWHKHGRGGTQHACAHALMPLRPAGAAAGYHRLCTCLPAACAGASGTGRGASRGWRASTAGWSGQEWCAHEQRVSGMHACMHLRAAGPHRGVLGRARPSLSDGRLKHARPMLATSTLCMWRPAARHAHPPSVRLLMLLTLVVSMACAACSAGSLRAFVPKTMRHAAWQPGAGKSRHHHSCLFCRLQDTRQKPCNGPWPCTHRDHARVPNEDQCPTACTRMAVQHAASFRVPLPFWA